jgi:CRISPR/Cas system-associated exonuclease Cas4 (RecB family)
MNQVVSLCIGSEPELHRLELVAALSYAMAVSAEQTVSVNDEELAYVDLLDTLLLKHNYNPVEMDDSDKFTFCRLLRTEVSQVIGLEFLG